MNYYAIKKRILLFIVLGLLLQAIHPLNARPDIVIGEYKLIKTIPWPIKPRPPIGVELLHDKVDLEDRVSIIFNTQSAYLSLFFEGEWKKSSNRSSRYSCTLHQYTDHKSRFSISEFKPGEFLDSLDEDEWAGYKKYLDRRFPKTIINYEEDGKGLDREIIVFSKYYRQIAYTYKSSQNVLTKAREVFVFLGENLYVFTFSGPASTFDKQWRQQSIYISRMEAIPKDQNGKPVPRKPKKSPVTIR